MVNVDLLIKDEKGRTLLAWRDDPYCGKGWHIPGGIIRFKETFEQRVQKVAQTEIGIDSIKFDSTPIDLNQIIIPHYQIRGHFISILYKCFLSGTFRPHNNGLRHDQPGFLSWHDGCPENLIPYHSIYRKYLT
jgi:colanic acid biosynthesis protein WcaH